MMSEEKTRGGTTPLWIIGLFVGMSEIMAGTTVIKTEGFVQIISVLFMCLFTTGVASAFFYILWARSEVLFPPSEYIGIDIEKYVKNVSGRTARDREIVDRVTDKIESEINSRAEISLENRKDIATAIKSVKQEFIHVLFPASNFNKKKDIEFELFSEGWSNFSDFLDEIYVLANNSGIRLPAYTYGKYWVLKNAKDGTFIQKSVVGAGEDTRPLSAVNLQAGGDLIAEKL